ncbi:LOW QUALITY PROTEIN: m-AAA protease-interacting protein 1, mitochondrial [Sceloporus undulatus]|uniref:LOW QUALITY PROTEIN: m-AAA protease-interacting protein 1, mitochondrial n=1 Tax=Sceloporus undulatus TaxID=8520 RepID=UPI001C4D8529|nr:LOW QUALITY PROTEIN: m-AAA protease-interacting protein 1, mitochondrial [Sceloporus undulatus]
MALLLSSVGLCCRRCRGLLLGASPRRSFLLLAVAPPQPSPAGPGYSGRGPGLPPQWRPYSSSGGGGEWERGGGVRRRSVVVVGVPNPLVWLRTRLYFFLIRAYFDQEFSAQEFTQGAKQAFAHVSRLISHCKYDLLEELVSKEMIQMLKEKLSSLSENHRSALAADMDEIMYTTAGDVGIYYDDSGRKFVSILMRFWYLTSADLPDETPDGTKVFQVVFGDETTKETKRLLTANYEFRREFTQGVKPDWTITRIEHPKLLE